MARRLVLALSLFGAACADRAPVPAGPTDTPSRTLAPGPVAFGRTTDGAQAVSNLSAQVEGFEAALARSPADRILRSTLIDLLMARAQYLGRYDDFDRALALVSDDGLPRARVLLALHRFAEAETLLAEVDDPAAGGLERSLALARGLFSETALAERRRDAARSPSFSSWTALAGELAARGAFDEADAAFRAALESYRDVSPFPVAWVEFQRGVMWSEAAGRPEWAEPLYRAAVQRLPSYVVAQVHLAELERAMGRPAEAVLRLESVAEATQDPEPFGLLAELYLETGTGDAERARRRALEAYQDLLARHPAAFADHAAEFFMGVGADPRQALSLASENLARRKTDRAYDLAIRAALAAGEPARACSFAAEAAQVQRSSVPLAETISALRCPANAD